MAEPWYQDGLKFQCTACGKCCSGEPGYVWVNSDEIAELAQAMNLSDAQFRQQFVRQVGRRYSLREYPDGDCLLLDPKTRHCLAYEGRPIQCRTWPFWSSNLRTKEDWEQTCRVCPGAGTGKLYSFDHIEIQRKKKRV
ncbi:MAG: YkgJ family cysteine cluster protein [Pirellulaceae bacterium]|nr:YkgJ family cysteine cluster protein [Pirellulaceae bacterium]